MSEEEYWARLHWAAMQAGDDRWPAEMIVYVEGWNWWRIGVTLLVVLAIAGGVVWAVIA